MSQKQVGILAARAFPGSTNQGPNKKKTPRSPASFFFFFQQAQKRRFFLVPVSSPGLVVFWGLPDFGALVASGFQGSRRSFGPAPRTSPSAMRRELVTLRQQNVTQSAGRGGGGWLEVWFQPQTGAGFDAKVNPENGEFPESRPG